MKNNIIKLTSASLLFFGIGFFIIKGFAALSSVTSGTPLTASTWNNMISNFYWGSGSNGIYYNGKVAIGTTNPTYNLEVIGSIYGNAFVIEGPAAAPQFNIKASSTYHKGINFRETDTGKTRWMGHRRSAENSLFSFWYYNGTSRKYNLSILTGGNVGIGTNTPSYTLHVNGTAAGTSWTNVSDFRFKKNISTITGALDKINSLRGVNFDWRVGEFSGRNFQSGHRIGFIAQEVEQILPQVVNTDNQGFKSVEYSNLTAVLVEAIKQQQKEINELKNKIQILENK